MKQFQKPLECLHVQAFLFAPQAPVASSFEQSPSQGGNSSLASREIFRILWNPLVPCRVHNSPPPVSE